MRLQYPAPGSWMNGTLITLASLLAAALPGAASHAGNSLGAPYDQELAASTAAAIQDQEIGPWLARFQSAWEKRCGDSGANDVEDGKPSCRLQECDVLPASACRPNRVLLFRGEDQRFAQPNVSALARTHLRGSLYAPKAKAVALLDQLARDLSLMRPKTFGPQNEPLLLQRDATPAGWYYVDEDGEPSGFYKPDGPGETPSTLVGLLFHLHAQASALLFRDPALKADVALDPFVSFSEDPSLALAFARPEDDAGPDARGRLIVASVPVAELADCGDQMPPPGSLIDSRRCALLGEHAEERELDALLYLRPGYFWKSFRIKPDQL